MNTLILTMLVGVIVGQWFPTIQAFAERFKHPVTVRWALCALVGGVPSTLHLTTQWVF